MTAKIARLACEKWRLIVRNSFCLCSFKYRKWKSAFSAYFTFSLSKSEKCCSSKKENCPICINRTSLSKFNLQNLSLNFFDPPGRSFSLTTNCWHQSRQMGYDAVASPKASKSVRWLREYILSNQTKAMKAEKAILSVPRLVSVLRRISQEY